ncbi:MAG TPA: alpha/beta hydrolase [Gemmatimonadaceae bacterium]|nr:alpha/beta hydrolase [Gemmatimonadaceae bacterium]
MGKVLSRDGTTIAFDRSGHGPPLVLVTGALSDRSSWMGLPAFLESRFTVFVYDRRGRGVSGDTLPYAVAREVEDLEALVAQAGGVAGVFGVSSGAALALEAAARGVAFSRLALFEPPYRVDESAPRPPADLWTKVAQLTSSGRPGDAVEYFMTQAVGLPSEAVARMRNAPMWPGLEALAHTLLRDFEIMGDGSFPADRAASVALPTLVIGSEGSAPWLRRAVQAVGDALPNSETRFFAGQFHSIPPETLAPALEEFFGGGDLNRTTPSRQADSRADASSKSEGSDQPSRR